MLYIRSLIFKTTMKINPDVRLFLRDVYSYDIEACHYQILQKIGYDVSNIERDDKTKRNIQIGMLIRRNPRLGKILRNTTNSIISNYLHTNKVSDYELIIRQYDGVFVTRYLEETTNQEIELLLKNLFVSFISSIRRNSFIAFDGNIVIIKGVSYRYKAMDGMIQKIAQLNFANKAAVFKGLQKIKDELFTTIDPFLFAIPVNNDKYSIFLKKYGEINISNTTVKLVDVEDIDREKYFNFYIRPFTESLVLEFS
jgi:hypothetical protein